MTLFGSNSHRVLAATCVGTLLEFYEFSLFGVFATVISREFFPEMDPRTSLTLGLAVFLMGCIGRMIGAFCYGRIGDTKGRTNALCLSVLSMTFATCLMGCLPGYAQIGILAPFLLVMCRLVQGLSAGGEYNGASIFLIESFKTRPGLLGALICSSGMMGSLLAISIGHALTGPEMPAWAWRIAFIISPCLGGVGLYLRRSLQDDPQINQILKEFSAKRPSALSVITQHATPFFQVIGIAGLNGILTFFSVAYINIYLVSALGYDLPTALTLNGFTILLIIFLDPLFGHLSDKFGARWIMSAAALVMLVLAYPLFLLLNAGTPVAMASALGLSGLITAGYAGGSNALMNSLLPVQVRYTGVSLAYSIGISVFGGTMPLISNTLLGISPTSPSFYLMFGALIALIALNASALLKLFQKSVNLPFLPKEAN